MRPKIIPFPSAATRQYLADTARAECGSLHFIPPADASLVNPICPAGVGSEVIIDQASQSSHRLLPGLPTRLANIVSRLGYASAAEVAAAIQRGNLVFNERHVLHRANASLGYRSVRNCGFASYAVIAAWAGATPIRDPSASTYCTLDPSQWNSPNSGW